MWRQPLRQSLARGVPRHTATASAKRATGSRHCDSTVDTSFTCSTHRSGHGRCRPRCFSSSNHETSPQHELPSDMSSSTPFLSVYDDSPDWRDWFTAAEYESPWDPGSPRLSPLGSVPAVEYASRHAIQQLQEVNFIGGSTDNHNSNPRNRSRNRSYHNNNVATTDLGNAILAQLLHEQYPMFSRKVSDADRRRSRAVAERALAIYENMEFYTTTKQKHDTRADPLESLWLDASHIGQPPSRVTRILPTPNRLTYQYLLMICARTYGIDDTMPRTVQRLIERMHHRHTVQRELDMQPTNFHTNCALEAWLRSSDPQRAVRAAEFVLDLWRPSSSSSDLPQQPEHNSIAAASCFHHDAPVDASSFLHALRVCVFSIQPRDDHSAVLSANAAVQIWKGLFDYPHHENDASQAHLSSLTTTAATLPFPLTSHFYSFFLQAIRGLPDARARTNYFATALAHAAQHGKVNKFVLQEFFCHVRDKAAQEYFLGPYLQSVWRMPTEEAVETILAQVPRGWTEHADERMPAATTAMPPPSPQAVHETTATRQDGVLASTKGTP